MPVWLFCSCPAALLTPQLHHCLLSERPFTALLHQPTTTAASCWPTRGTRSCWSLFCNTVPATQVLPPLFPGLLAADQLLANKRNRELLEPYEDREEAACGYMRMVNPGATVVAGPLTDPKVRQGSRRSGGWWVALRVLLEAACSVWVSTDAAATFPGALACV